MTTTEMIEASKRELMKAHARQTLSPRDPVQINNLQDDYDNIVWLLEKMTERLANVTGIAEKAIEQKLIDQEFEEGCG